MSSHEKAIVIVLGLLILGGVVSLILPAPIGSLGSADGQSFDVDRFGLIGFVGLCLGGGCLFVRSQPRKTGDSNTKDTESQEGVWPPAAQAVNSPALPVPGSF